MQPINLPHDNKQKGLEVGELAPTWMLKDLDGKLTGLFRYFGQPLVLFFFRGTWCASCRQQIAQITAEWSRISPLAEVVGVMRENEKSIRDFLSHNSIPFPLLADPEANVIKLHNVYQRFGLNGFRIANPTVLILDRDQVVQYCYVGLTQFDRPDLSEVIAELEKLNVPTSNVPKRTNLVK